MDRQKDGQADIWTDRQAWTDRQIDRCTQTDRHLDRRTHRQTGGQIGRWTD